MSFFHREKNALMRMDAKQCVDFGRWLNAYNIAHPTGKKMVDYKFLADKAKKEWGKNFSADTMKLKYRWYKTKQRDGLLPC